MIVIIAQDGSLMGRMKAQAVLTRGGIIHAGRNAQQAHEAIDGSWGDVREVWIPAKEQKKHKKQLEKMYFGKLTVLQDDADKSVPASRLDRAILNICYKISNWACNYGFARLPLVWKFLRLKLKALLKGKKLKITMIYSARIGHLAFNTHVYLLKNRYSKNYLVDADHPRSKPCNRALFDMYKSHFDEFHTDTKFMEMLKLPMVKNAACYTDTQFFGDVHEPLHTQPDNTRIFLEFSLQQEAKGRDMLKEMGIKFPFVCIHARDKSYLDKEHSYGQWDYHNFRDADIETYRQAVEYLISQGFFVVRLGAVVEKPFSVNSNMYLDYASSGYRSDFMDLYLLAKCKFLLGGCTGLTQVATVFGTPVAVANWCHVEYSTCFRKGDIILPKRVVISSAGQEMSIKQQIDSGVGRIIDGDTYANNNLEVVDNTPMEILGLAKTMLHGPQDGDLVSINEFCRPDHRCAGSPVMVYIPYPGSPAGT